MLELDDIAWLEKLPFVISAFPQLNLYKEIRTRENATRGNIRGVDQGYLKARILNLTEGRNFSPDEIEERTPVCLISEGAAKELFPDGEALGKTLYVEGAPWQVIGLYASPYSQKGQASEGIEVLAPLATVIRNEKELS